MKGDEEMKISKIQQKQTARHQSLKAFDLVFTLRSQLRT